jgi:hypothetical protein
MDCPICFCQLKDLRVRCTDSDCMTEMCIPCAEQYVNVSFRDNSNLKCPRPECHGVYDETSLQHVSEMSKKEYREWLLMYLKSKNPDDIDSMAESAALQKMREEKTAFYKESLPSAVLAVAKIAFASRLKNVKQQAVATAKVDYRRRCISLVCKGVLDGTMCCSMCKNTYCKDCEEILVDGHVCNESQAKSVAYVKTLTQCPKCNTAVEKGEGCDAITCAVCFTNFWYSTGEEGAYGNHGKSIKVSIRDNRKLSVEFREILTSEMATLIKEAESKYFSESQESHRKRIAKLVVSVEGKQITLERFSRLYSKYTRDHAFIAGIGRKLFTVEKTLRERPEDWERKVMELLSTERVGYYLYEVMTHDKLIVVLDSKLYKSLDEIGIHAGLSKVTVSKMLNSGKTHDKWMVRAAGNEL